MKANRSAGKRLSTRDKVLRKIEHRWKTAGEIAASLGVSVNSVQYSLYALLGTDVERRYRKGPNGRAHGAPYEYRKVRAATGEQVEELRSRVTGKWAFPEPDQRVVHPEAKRINPLPEPEGSFEDNAAVVGVTVAIGGKTTSIPINEAKVLFDGLKKIFGK